MSQHNITLKSPLLGTVHVTAGFDPRLKELFIIYFSLHENFRSLPGLHLQAIPRIVRKRLQVELPHQIVKGIEQDLLDFDRGVADVGRRIRCYDADGSLVTAGTF